MKKKLLLTISLFILVGCSNKKEVNETKKTEISEPVTTDLDALDFPQLNLENQDTDYIMNIETTMGNIEVILFPEQAPKAVENFIKHSEKGDYNNTKIHRVVSDFIIQGGDPEGTGTGGESIWGGQFKPEISKQLYHLNGALAMARSAGTIEEKTQGSQFYIVYNNENQLENIKNYKYQNNQDLLLEKDYPKAILEEYKKGGAPFLDNQYTVFGHVINGIDVVKEISNVPVEHEEPIKEINVTKISK